MAIIEMGNTKHATISKNTQHERPREVMTISIFHSLYFPATCTCENSEEIKHYIAKEMTAYNQNNGNNDAL